MQTKPFSQPIAIRTDGGNTEIVSTAAALVAKAEATGAKLVE